MKRFFTLLIVFSMISLHVFSQEPVKGIVTIERGNPVANVEVIVKGTDIKTTTNQNGEFVITIPEGSYIRFRQLMSNDK